MLLQGVELGTINVPLHKMTLKYNLVSGPMIVGVRSSLPLQGITVLLGNDLAGGRVLQSPRVSEVQQMRCDDVTRTADSGTVFCLCCDVGYGTS